VNYNSPAKFGESAKKLRNTGNSFGDENLGSKMICYEELRLSGRSRSAKKSFPVKRENYSYLDSPIPSNTFQIDFQSVAKNQCKFPRKNESSPNDITNQVWPLNELFQRNICINVFNNSKSFINDVAIHKISSQKQEEKKSVSRKLVFPKEAGEERNKQRTSLIQASKYNNLLSIKEKLIQYASSVSHIRRRIKKRNPKKLVLKCTCTKTGCQKKYCECFRNGKSCQEDCACKGCQNTTKKCRESWEKSQTSQESRQSFRRKGVYVFKNRMYQWLLHVFQCRNKMFHTLSMQKL